MKSITPVVSIVLLITMTLVAAGGAFFFINSNVANLQSETSLDNYPGMDNSKLNLVSITGSKAIVRNDGSSPVTDLVIFVNGELLNYSLSEPILPGELREINYNARMAGQDLTLMFIYNNGKTEQDTSPAAVNTPASGFTETPEPLNYQILDLGYYRNIMVFPYGNYLYLAKGYKGFEVYDISEFVEVDPESDWIILPQLVKTITGINAKQIYSRNNDYDNLYLAAGDKGYISYSIIDPSNPVQSSNYSTEDIALGFSNEANIYISAKNSGLLTYNIVSMELIDTDYDGGTAYSVIFNKNTLGQLYLSAGTAGLITYNIADVNDPLLTSSSYDGGEARSSLIIDNLLYVAAGNAGLLTYDISDPNNPIFIGNDSECSDAYSVMPSYSSYPSNIYVACGFQGLFTYNLYDPYDPQYEEKDTQDFIVQGLISNDESYLFVNAGNDGLKMYIINDPDHPVYTPFPLCFSNDQCDDFNPCTQNTCSAEGKCVYTNFANGQYTGCTGTEGCSGSGSINCACLNGTCSNTCGDGTCQFGETAISCSKDCLFCQENQGGCSYTWLDKVKPFLSNYNYCACCGDDGDSDYFYSASQGCFEGSVITDKDLMYEFCINSYSWLSGSITGSTGPCCGDDYKNDIFYDDYSEKCSYGGYLLDSDSLYIEDFNADNKYYTSGKGVCELESNTWLMSNNTSFGNNNYVYAGSDSYGFFLGDLNSDTYIDFISTNSYSNTLSVYLNNGTGFFTFSGIILNGGCGPFDIAFGDIDGDGYLDEINSASCTSSFGTSLNDGSGSFSSRHNYALSGSSRGIALGDINNDGSLDVITTELYNNQISTHFNDGTGLFSSGGIYYSVGSSPMYVAVGDLNKNGDIDIAVTNSGNNTVSVLFNNGNGTFSELTDYVVGSNPNDVSVGDLDNDGDNDIITTNSTHINILFNDGTGIFSGLTSYAVSSLRNVALGDFNNDGSLDLAASRGTTATIQVYMNTGSGSFYLLNTYNADSNAGIQSDLRRIDTGDFDNDGDLDIIVADIGDDTIVILFNEGITGLYGPCCGDEGWETFTNGTHSCCSGIFQSGSC